MARLPFSRVLARKLQDARRIDLLHFGGDRLRAFKAVLITILVFGATYPCGAVIPSPYYVNVSWDDHTVRGIKELLGDGFIIPYQDSVFDCSEMTSYVFWLLTCHGFDAGMCVDAMGPWSRTATSIGHTWVDVRFWNDTTGVYEGLVYIETTDTPPRVISFLSPDWDRYHRAAGPGFLDMKHYFSIESAIAGNIGESELDWWQFGTDLIKKPAPYKRITAEDILRLRASVAAFPPK
jgi:hypothetical protein